MDFALSRKSYTCENILLWGLAGHHWRKAHRGQMEGRNVHWYIAIVEALPIIGQIASLFEAIIVWALVQEKAKQQVPHEFRAAVNAAPLFRGYVVGNTGLAVRQFPIRPVNLFCQALNLQTTLPAVDSSKVQPFAFLQGNQHAKDEIESFAKQSDLLISGQEFCLPDKSYPFGQDIYAMTYGEVQNVIASQQTATGLPRDFFVGLTQAMRGEDAAVFSLDLEGHQPLINFKTEKYPILKQFLEKVEAAPLTYGFKKAEEFAEYLEWSLFKIGCLVAKRENFHLFVDGNMQIRGREAGSKDVFRLVHITGVRDSKSGIAARNALAAKQSFKGALAMAEEGIIILPAVGMGVWGGDPNLYWRAFFDAVLESPRKFELMLVNPAHSATPSGSLYIGETGDEFLEIWQEYLEANKDKPAALEKLQKICTVEKDLMQLAYEMRMAFPEKQVSLVNASDPIVTLGDNVGNRVNSMSATPTTEENYMAIGTMALALLAN